MPPNEPLNNSEETKISLPPIKLDITLSDLYKQHCPSLADKRIGHIFCGTTCTADLSPEFPRNRKYVYQDGAFNDAFRSQKTDDEVQKLLSAKYLSLVPQRDAFVAGDTPVIFFHSGSSKAEIEHDKAEADRTLVTPDEKQKPEVVFSNGPRHVAKVMEERGIDRLSSKLILDGIAELVSEKMLVNPDTLWYLNSKEALTRSGLPTPKADIVEVQGHCPSASGCCDVCEDKANEGDVVVRDNCTGPRKRWVGEQSLRITSAIESQSLPFVFKNQQTFGGAGTYIIIKEQDRNQLLEELLQGKILTRMLSHITSENQHLRPGTVLLTEMIEDPVADYGITFFVGESGPAMFLAASEQMIDRESASWTGSTISYAHQDTLRDKFGPLVRRTGHWLHEHGYIGPAGVDILESKDGDLQIVDLNVRTSGSLCLPLMRNHFTSRGFHFAVSMSITAEESRQAFCKQWQGEIESGQICILAWYEDDNHGKSFGDIVIGAEDEARLQKALDKVRKATGQVTF